MANIDEKDQYVDWAGLRFYDARLKSYIETNFASEKCFNQLRTDLEQLETSVQTSVDHIFNHLETLDSTSVNKVEFNNEIQRLESVIRSITGGSLPEDIVDKDYVDTKIQEYFGNLNAILESYATIENLESSISNVRLELTSQIDDLRSVIQSLTAAFELHTEEAVTKEDIEGLATEEYVDAAIAAIQPPDMSQYAKLSDIPDTSEFLTSIPEEYVTEEDLATKNYLTTEDASTFAKTNDVQQVEQQVTELQTHVETTYIKVSEGVTQVDLEQAVTNVVTTKVETLIDDKIEEVITNGATVSSISYGEF